MPSPNSISNLYTNYCNQLATNNHLHPLTTGFQSFDKEIGGLSLGELVVIAGRPSMGKTQVTIDMAIHIAKQYPVAYFSFDLSQFLLTNRIVSTLSHVAAQKILKGNCTETEKIKLAGVKEQIEQLKLSVLDELYLTITHFKGACNQLIRESGVKVIFVDNLHKISFNTDVQDQSEEIHNIILELSTIAKENNICVVATSQLSRSLETRGYDNRPELYNLRDSGPIEPYTDKVIFVYRPEYYRIPCDEFGNDLTYAAELIVAKNKSGKLFTAHLKRDEEFTTFFHS